MTKTCRTCRVTKDTSGFYPDKGKKFGVSGQCKDCTKAERRARYADNPAKYNKQNAAWRENNPSYGADKYREWRMAAINAYGGRCICCGEEEPVFLAFDHVNDDGAEHRKADPRAANIVMWLKKRGFPVEPRFQLLCHNCNWAKQYGGCPHQRKGDQHSG